MREGGLGAARAARVVAAVGAVLLLCVVVAAASVGRAAGSEASTPFDSRAAATLFAAGSFVVLAGFLAMAIGVLLRMLRSDDDDPDEEDEQDSALEVTTPVWLQRLIVAGIAVMTAVCCWVTWLVIRAFLTSTPPPDAVVPGSPSATTPPPPVEVSGDIVPNIAVYVLVAMVLALLVLTIAVALRRPSDDDDAYGRTEHEPPTERAELEGDPFAADLGALAREQPRAAVIVAFALAQRMLGASGFGARWEETSAEHVHRVGPTLPGAAPPALDHLLARYHEAKFSDHPIPTQHRDDALAALALLRDTLAPLTLTAAIAP